MTGEAGGGAGSIARTLWNRAPLWRFCVMTAGLLTLLFVLFPPRPAPPAPSAADTPSAASYTPQHRSPSDTGASTTAAAPPTAPVTPTVTSPTTAPPHGAMRSTARALPTPQPKTATLAMATPGPAKRVDVSGVDDALMGRLYRGSALVDGFAVPLPTGDWANLANSTIKTDTGAGDAHFLGRIRNKRLIAAVRIFAARSNDTPGAGFNEVKSCTEVNPQRHFVSIDGTMTPHGHQACWTIRNVYATPWAQWADRNIKISSIDRAAADDMAAKGVSFPQDFVALTFTRTETWGLLEVMYLFSPEAEGISSNTVLSVGESDWTATNIRPYAEKVAYVDKMKSWGIDFWPRFQSAFDAGAPR